MIVLDGALLALQRHARGWAAEMAPYSAEVDRDPAAVTRHRDLPVYARMATLQVPEKYNSAPLVVDGHRYYLVSALEQVLHAEECAAVDLGMTLGAPGAPMAGATVAMLGDDRQQEWFYGRLLERVTWSFFALTEPHGGSDAAATKTSLRARDDGEVLTLDGAKRYVTNSVRARLGVVFARAGAGPLALSAALLELPTPGYTAEPIPTIGLRGAQLGAITFDAVEVPPDRVLGRHLPPIRRGMLGWLSTLHKLRPVAAAMAVGVARAAYEYVVANRRDPSAAERLELDRIRRRIEGVRQLTWRAAAAVDRDPADGALGSAAKVRAVRLAEETTLAALGFFGTGARLDHPALDKLARDACGVEYMEGTGNVQRLGLFGSLTRNEVRWS
ncbi:acyl-CoA dehydrogenase family protein [Plantactinospora sp. KLBMP9567]|uniref:acyl-CoA dehydrogenase family protein n=1 Tax=Plantactinospora sp. KLBMP9567 TaxID=3085900 RepID=UPI002981AF3A|nr:acyl-CoA dehydrogenase family protein [Plantactinospora sp. KLBMP9567]MDW5329523.1 acyl-CoA dehydrogenase family protein [Plantactinospora sp. KLBMP9567]